MFTKKIGRGSKGIPAEIAEPSERKEHTVGEEAVDSIGKFGVAVTGTLPSEKEAGAAGNLAREGTVRRRRRGGVIGSNRRREMKEAGSSTQPEEKRRSEKEAESTPIGDGRRRDLLCRRRRRRC
ncbi:hypothetical protein KSP40_PGU018942 [Platanthera guangdongensis]|uniref:Uncharacterized protein n=1 Tax=Platanthera guangdongensis TaxID=2320717 RepID=A0ABR2M436_9ASPA